MINSQHLVAEFVSRFLIERNALAAIGLEINSSNMSVIRNDYGYENIFSRELDALRSNQGIFKSKS